MRVLIVGTGIIGTIYGWALHEAGIDVTHLVRKGKIQKFNAGFTMDVLDERKGFEKYKKTLYPAKCIEDIGNNGSFELIIVPVNYNQVEEVLTEIVPQCRDAKYFILASLWGGTDFLDKTVGRDKYITGYPDGGGTVKNGVYRTNIGSEIHMARPGIENKGVFDMVVEIFNKASVRPDIQDNMIHWLWVHDAGYIAIWAALQKYKNIEKFVKDKNLLKDSFIATRECLKLCEKRGVGLGKYPDVSSLFLPLWFVIPMFKNNLKYNESMQRYTAHAENAPAVNFISLFGDVLKTADELGFSMPVMKSLEKYLL